MPGQTEKRLVSMLNDPKIAAALFLAFACFIGSTLGHKEEHEASELFPWLDTGGAGVNLENGGLLSRSRRSTDGNETSRNFWEEIEHFYSDKNNMAMYCVLPILVLIYGGCASIYCIHKCRLYIKRKKHKRLKEEDCDSLDSDKNDLNKEDTVMVVGNEDLDPVPGRAVSQISQAWADLEDQTMTGGPTWSGQTEAAPEGKTPSPLPWQMTDKAAAASLAQTSAREGVNMSRASYIPDKLRNDDIRSEGVKSPSYEMTASQATDRGESRGGVRSQSEVTTQILAAATVTASSTDPDDEPQPQQHQQRHVDPPVRRPPMVVKSAEVQQPFESTRIHANLNDYSSKTSAMKATDYSRFSDSKPIEIIPLSADPNLRVWDPLHNRPFGDPENRKKTRISPLIEPGPSTSRGGATGGRESVNAMKEEMLARYEALTTYQMAKKAAQILQTNAVEKSPFQRKANNKKKHIFIAE